MRVQQLDLSAGTHAFALILWIAAGLILEEARKWLVRRA